MLHIAYNVYCISIRTFTSESQCHWDFNKLEYRNNPNNSIILYNIVVNAYIIKRMLSSDNK